MTDCVKPNTLKHLFYMAQGFGAWQHFNYYLERYTQLPLLKDREDIDNISSLYCMANKDKIVRHLANDLFGVDLK